MKEISIDLLSGKVVLSVEKIKDYFGYDLLCIYFEDGTQLYCSAERDSDLIVSTYTKDDEE